MLLTTKDSLIDNPLGQILRLPCKFIKGESDVSPMIISAIAEELRRTGRNVLPVVVISTGEDKYKVVLNAHIITAARQAKLDFAWCIIVNDDMEKQLRVEKGELIQVNLKTATEKELISFFEFIKTQEKGFSKIEPLLTARVIIEYRQANNLQNLDFLTKLKCGIGKTKLPLLKPFILI
jgi:uncharacterized protein YfkK (UPF0435 family)